MDEICIAPLFSSHFLVCPLPIDDLDRYLGVDLNVPLFAAMILVSFCAYFEVGLNPIDMAVISMFFACISRGILPYLIRNVMDFLFLVCAFRP